MSIGLKFQQQIYSFTIQR